MEDMATIIDKPVETLGCVHGNGPFMGQLMCGDKAAAGDTILILHTDEEIYRMQVDSYIFYDITQGEKEDQPRWVDMAGDEDMWDMMRMTCLAIQQQGRPALPSQRGGGQPGSDRRRSLGDQLPRLQRRQRRSKNQGGSNEGGRCGGP